MATLARYKGSRVGRCRTANSYTALEETYQYTFDNPDPIPDTVFVVEQGADMNEVKAFEPQFRPSSFINVSSPMCYSMFNRYDEFRIRNVEVKITPFILNPQNYMRSDLWIWWCPNHYEEDEDAKVGDTFDNVTDMEEAARIQRVGVTPGRAVRLKVVPQLTMNQESQTVAGTVIPNFGDRPAPWLRCSSTNINDISLRMPVFYFRRPYVAAGFPSGSGIHQYQVTLTAVIEFRNLDDDN